MAKTISLIILIVCLFFAIGGSFSLKTKNENLSFDLLKLSKENQNIYNSLNKFGEEIASSNSIVLNQSREISKQASEIDSLKTLKSQTKIKLITEFKDILIPFQDSIFIQKSDTVFFTKAEYSDDWISFSSEIKKEGLKINNISITNRYTVEIGYEKQGFFEKPIPRAYILNENPYTTTQTIQSFQFESVKPWHQKKGTWFVGGLIAGLIFNNSRK